MLSCWETTQNIRDEKTGTKKLDISGWNIFVYVWRSGVPSLLYSAGDLVSRECHDVTSREEAAPTRAAARTPAALSIVRFSARRTCITELCVDKLTQAIRDILGTKWERNASRTFLPKKKNLFKGKSRRITCLKSLDVEHRARLKNLTEKLDAKQQIC